MHTRLLRTGIPWVFCAIAASIASATGQATFRIVANMNRYDQPAGLIEGSPGVFYGIAGSAQGVTFSVTTQGSITILSSFPSGDTLESVVMSAANGRFYSSVAQTPGLGHLFSVTSVPGGEVTYPGQNVIPELLQNLPDGNLLGVGIWLASNLWGPVKSDLNGNVTSLYQFPSSVHLSPTIVYATDSNYYGFSLSSTSTAGYVYQVTPSGASTNIYAFSTSDFKGNYLVPLLQATDGNLYGATPTGGANGTGTIYKLTTGGQYTQLYEFPKGKDWNPTWLIEASDGNLYGATLGIFGYSQLFRITKSGQYTPLYSMTNPGADAACQCDLVQGSDGIIYGTAQGGGATGAGAVFALDAGLPKPTPWLRRLQPSSGSVGTRVLIWGSNLLSASVAFNGVAAAKVSNSGANYVWAEVPAGATTGPVTVTTPGGSFTTKETFTVQ
jgi:uncharacterized repeat protein (TIGR03803 family)